MPLSKAQRDHLEERLREERARLLRELDRSVDDTAGASEQDRSGDLTKVPFHLADLGTDEMQAELEASNATRMSRELAEIDDALERLYHDPEHFGLTADGRDIPYARLDAIPWARTIEEPRTSPEP